MREERETNSGKLVALTSANSWKFVKALQIFRSKRSSFRNPMSSQRRKKNDILTSHVSNGKYWSLYMEKCAFFAQYSLPHFPCSEIAEVSCAVADGRTFIYMKSNVFHWVPLTSIYLRLYQTRHDATTSSDALFVRNLKIFPQNQHGCQVCLDFW